jgi:Zn-dependent peptidase ImmA (M78 family)/transcriptional regulator with XRE-family HTH domain
MTTSKRDSPQYALDHLDPQRITYARELRGLTKKELADNIGKSSSAISQIERGGIRPDLETFVSLAFALKVPASFFVARATPAKPIELASCHFRSLRSVSQTLRRQSARKGDLLIDLMELLESRGILFPKEELSDFSGSVETFDHIEESAVLLRKHWNMGMGPIPNIVKLVESKGVIVLPLPGSCSQVDAYSTWRGQRPCMLLSFAKSASRVRFDVSHELAHLALHEDTAAGEAKTETQANRFAGAFLAPRESFIEECPRRWNLQAFQQLKIRWRMSIAAALYRAKDLGCISTSTHQRAMIQLSQLGMRKNEGQEWPMEKPVLLTQSLELLSDQITLSDLAGELSVHPAELKTILSECISLETLEKIDKKREAEPAAIVKLRK